MIIKKLSSSAIIILFIVNGCVQKKDNSSVLQNQELSPLKKGDYAVEVSSSKLIWTGKEVSTKQHNGTLDIKNGKIIISDKGLISGDIEIDMSTINTTDLQGKGKDRLDGHLKSPDFFDVKQYPVAYLEFQGNEKSFSDGKLKFDGELTIKNIEIMPGEKVIIPTGFSLSIPKGFEVQIIDSNNFDYLFEFYLFEPFNFHVKHCISHSRVTVA